MTKDVIYEMYEDGSKLAEIAEAIGKTAAEVTALLKVSDDNDDLLQAREQKHCRILRRVRAMADALTLQYLERLQETIDRPDSDEKQKAAAFVEMEKVLKIAKLYSDRLLLAEGRTTENIGINGNAGLPFNVVFTKTYEQPATSDQPTANELDFRLRGNDITEG